MRNYVRILPVVAILVPLFILSIVGWLGWRTIWQTTETEMLRAAESAAEYGKRTLESYNIEAGRVNDRLRGLSDEAIRRDEAFLHAELKRIGSELTQSELTYVIDRNGYALLASNRFPAPRAASLADRDYFRALSAPDAPNIHISSTFIGRFDGKLLFSVSRRRSETGNPRIDGGFDGVVVVSVNPLVLAEGLRRLASETTDLMAFVTAEGHTISATDRMPEPGQIFPQVDPSAPFYANVKSGAQSAVYVSETAFPGTQALLGMHKIEGFPVYAVSIRQRSEITARWWAMMQTHLVFGIPAMLALFLLSLQVMRDQLRLAGINADLQRDNDLSLDRLVRARRFGLVGTFEYDPRKDAVRRSPDYLLSGAASEAPVIADSLGDWRGQLHPDDRQRAESELAEALADATVSDYAQSYRIITPSGDTRWIAARGEISRDETGRAIMLLGAHVDVTPLRSTELALAESDARLRLAREAVGIGAWEWRSASRLLTCSRRMAELCGFDPVGPPPTLSSLLARIHPQDRLTLRSLTRQMKRSGGFSGEFRILRPRADGETETIWLAARATLMTSAEISHPLLMGIAYDITERKRAEELRTMMAHEVEHRAKNALAVVSSLLRMTKAESVAQLVRVMEGRVRALSETMALLGRGGWQGAQLADIIRSELMPFESSAPGDGFEIEISGPDVVIDVRAAQPLSMALHELITNAAKYGALSVPGGSISVTWQVTDGRVHLRWEEKGGPLLSGPPARSGFGSKLIRMLFEGQIGGTVQKEWQDDGLVCIMSFPPGNAAESA